MLTATGGTMDLVPVIDLKAGQVVHARRGARDEYRPIETPLSATSAPADVIGGLLRLFPFRCLYVADLDAIERRGDHAALIDELANEHPGLEFWVDNGAQSPEFARQWLAATPAHLVVGSESQTSPDLLRALGREQRAVLSLDFRGESFQGPAEILNDTNLWPDRVVVMTLARVGAEQGPDFARIRAIAARKGRHRIYAAGGVRNEADLHAVARAGAAGALVATALHNGTLNAEGLRRSARL